VFPAVVPEPEPPPSTEPRDESAPTDLSTELSRYPCPDCRDLSPRQIPHYYCAACKAEWEKRCQEEREQEAAKQRAWYARREERQQRATPPTTCPICGTQFKGRRKDARFCSDRCRQRAHRQPVKDKNNYAAQLNSSRDSCKQARPPAGRLRQAPRWRLTELGYMRDAPTRNFTRWDGQPFKDTKQPRPSNRATLTPAIRATGKKQNPVREKQHGVCAKSATPPCAKTLTLEAHTVRESTHKGNKEERE
jgi:hypothetical protein